MPNQLSFEVQFTRDQIQEILDNPNTEYFIVSGTYEYRPDLGVNVWEMFASGEGCDSNSVKLAASRVDPCIKPC